MELITRLKEHYPFNKEEVKSICIVALIIGFMLSFKDWGPGDLVNYTYGLYMLIFSIIIAFIVLFFHLSLQRIVGIHYGFKSVYKMEIISIMASLMLCILTNGLLIPILPGAVTFTIVRRYRLGKWPTGMNYEPISAASIITLFTHVIIALLLQVINTSIGSVLLHKFIYLNLLFALFGLLPLPSTAGLAILYGSRLYYAFAAPLIGGAALLILFNAPAIIVLPVAILLALCSWAIYLWKFEKD